MSETSISEAISFKGIYTKCGIRTIEIPIIQRDYAQGRETEKVKRIRDRFLDVLYEALTGRKPVTLDFIYGDKDGDKMIPLDGQQRLTTLFLLHWYLGRHEGVGDKEMEFLKGFTYETRISSRDFCREIVKYNKIDFDKDTISDQLRDESWFQLEWGSDPTVQSMLVMLDSIHKKFRETRDLWEKLIGGRITFYFLPIKDMGLTDQLYIKMNSRGKPLTDFEHFKAELELKVKEVDEKLAGELSTKIDTVWTNLLWPYRNSGTGIGNEDEVTDDEFLRYIHYIGDIIGYKESRGVIRDDFELIDECFSNKAGAKAKENIQLLIQWFDLWMKVKQVYGSIKAFFESYISVKEHQEGKILVEIQGESHIPDLFHECCCWYGRNGQKFGLKETLLLYAFIYYLENKEEIEERQFRRRLRVVNNLIRNTVPRAEDMSVYLNLIDKIIKEGRVEQVEKGRAFQDEQTREEMDKLKWTEEHPNEAEALFKLEDHKYLNGYISVVGLENVSLCDRFFSLFSCDLDSINRALLAKADYFEVDTWRYQIGTSGGRTATTVWRTLFGPIRARTNEGLKKAVWELLRGNETFSKEILNEIADKFVEEAEEMPVRYYIAKYKSMRSETFGKYFWRDHNEKGKASYKVIKMSTETRLGGRNWDLFLNAIYENNSANLYLDDYSYYEYCHNEDKRARLTINDNGFYLTLEDDVYEVREKDGNLLESRKIQQNEQGIDIEDRVEVGIKLVEKYSK